MRALPNVYVDPVAMAPFSPAADATTRRLEELSAQIKELRQAIEALARRRRRSDACRRFTTGDRHSAPPSSSRLRITGQ